MSDLCRICSDRVVPAYGIILEDCSSNIIKGNVCHIPDTCSECEKTLNILRQTDEIEHDRIMKMLR